MCTLGKLLPRLPTGSYTILGSSNLERNAHSSLNSAEPMIELLNIGYSAFLLLLIAAGLAVIFGFLGVINLAHGEFLMLGAYAALMTTSGMRSFWPSLVTAPALVGIVALFVERGLMRRFYQRPLE